MPPRQYMLARMAHINGRPTLNKTLNKFIKRQVYQTRNVRQIQSKGQAEFSQRSIQGENLSKD